MQVGLGTDVGANSLLVRSVGAVTAAVRRHFTEKLAEHALPEDALEDALLDARALGGFRSAAEVLQSQKRKLGTDSGGESARRGRGGGEAAGVSPGGVAAQSGGEARPSLAPHSQRPRSRGAAAVQALSQRPASAPGESKQSGVRPATQDAHMCGMSGSAAPVAITVATQSSPGRGGATQRRAVSQSLQPVSAAPQAAHLVSASQPAIAAFASSGGSSATCARSQPHATALSAAAGVAEGVQEPGAVQMGASTLRKRPPVISASSKAVAQGVDSQRCATSSQPRRASQHSHSSGGAVLASAHGTADSQGSVQQLPARGLGAHAPCLQPGSSGAALAYSPPQQATSAAGPAYNMPHGNALAHSNSVRSLWDSAQHTGVQVHVSTGGARALQGHRQPPEMMATGAAVPGMSDRASAPQRLAAPRATAVEHPCSRASSAPAANVSAAHSWRAPQCGPWLAPAGRPAQHRDSRQHSPQRCPHAASGAPHRRYSEPRASHEAHAERRGWPEGLHSQCGASSARPPGRGYPGELQPAPSLCLSAAQHAAGSALSTGGRGHLSAVQHTTGNAPYTSARPAQ